jgi:hypothetical protein
MNSSSGWLARKPAGIVFNEHTDEDGATGSGTPAGFEDIASKRLREQFAPSSLMVAVARPYFCGVIVPRHGHRYTIGGLRRLTSCRGNVDLARRDDDLPARVLTTIKTRRRS